MAQQNINIGTSANKGDGDPLRTAFDKINDNFTELYAGGGGSATFLSLTDTPADYTGGASKFIKVNVAGDGLEYVADPGYLTSVPAQTFASLTGKPTTLAGYGITDAASNNNPTFTGAVDFTTATSIDFNTVTINNLDYTDISNTPTLFSGAYGDLTGAPTDISTFNNDSGYLTSVPAQTFVSLTDSPANFTGQAGKFVKVNAGETALEFDTVSGGAETDPIVGAITGIVKSDGAGNISAAVAGTDYSTFDGNYGSLSGTPALFSGVFADLTSKPTTIAGYGITDAFDGAFGSLSGTPTTLSGYGITDALASTSTGNVTLDVNGAGLGISIGNASTSGSTVSIGAEVNNTSVNMNGVTEFNARAIFSRGTHEIFYTFNGQGGVTDHNVMLGHLFYHTGVTGDLTPNFTNFDLTAEDATNITIIIHQGNTAYEIPAIQIGGAAQTIVWQNNNAPTGTANGTDSFSFTILNDGGTYVVLGQMVSFGGV